MARYCSCEHLLCFVMLFIAFVCDYPVNSASNDIVPRKREVSAEDMRSIFPSDNIKENKYESELSRLADSTERGSIHSQSKRHRPNFNQILARALDKYYSEKKKGHVLSTHETNNTSGVASQDEKNTHVHNPATTDIPTTTTATATEIIISPDSNPEIADSSSSTSAEKDQYLNQLMKELLYRLQHIRLSEDSEEVLVSSSSSSSDDDDVDGDMKTDNDINDADENNDSIDKSNINNNFNDDDTNDSKGDDKYSSNHNDDDDNDDARFPIVNKNKKASQEEDLSSSAPDLDVLSPLFRNDGQSEGDASITDASQVLEVVENRLLEDIQVANTMGISVKQLIEDLEDKAFQEAVYRRLRRVL